ncbi:preprotein translocase subunit SecY [PVC group bacterium (ex Bugula neritina AB1)]|nr:preprotein translocase subunit SecY [PVC group bacterium (ex Bugula neritina AB1)]
MILRVIQDIFKIKELKNKIFFTLALIFVYRIGAFVPTPGVDGHELSRFFATVSGGGNSLFGIMNMFSGGAMQKCTIFALGIMPYISASIIIQLLSVVVPYLERLSKEGELGRQKMGQYTRYGTILLGAMQSFFIAMWLENGANFQDFAVVPHPGFLFKINVVLTLTAGTAFIMWLGEKISEKGIGNGISLIIAAGILSRAPFAFMQMFTLLSPFSPERRQIQPMVGLLMLVVFLFIVVGVVLMTQGQRKIPVQYARRVVGRKMYGGQNTYLPLKINQAGVIPIIFASSVLMFPSTMAGLLPDSFFQKVANSLQYGEPLYILIEVFFIIFFTFFYTAITFNPIEISEMMKRNGGFIPGIRPGKPTATYLDSLMIKVTTAGAVFLALIAVMPGIVYGYAKIPFDVASFFGGTGLLIIVGVVLDTMKQIEGKLLMHNYEGFMSKGKIKGRS